MPDPTPDEAAARLRKDADEFESVSRGAAVPTSFAAAFWTRYDAVLAERDGLRTELLTTQQLLAHAERQRDEAEARVAAQQPVIDAAEEYVEIGGKWSHNELVRAVDAYRAASGSVEADTPAEPGVGRVFRCDGCGRFTRRVTPVWATGASPSIDREVCDECRPSREVAGTPAAEPAPDRAAADRVRAWLDARPNYGREDGSEPPIVASLPAVEGRGHLHLYTADLRALAGAGAPTEPADTQETTP